MKKLIAFVLAMACILCLFAGCGNTAPSSTTQNQQPSNNTPSSTPAPTQPEEPDNNLLKDGTYIFLNGNLTMAAISESATYGYAPFHTVTVNNGTVTGYDNKDLITVKNVEGGIVLQDCYGRYLSMSDPHNSFNVSTELPADGYIWELKVVDGGYNLVNTLTNKTVCYSTQYTSWGAYAEINSDRNPLFTIVAAEPVETPENPVLDGAPVNGDKVHIYLPSAGQAISHIADGSKLTGASATVENGTLNTDGAVFNVIYKDGYYTFECGGKYLTTCEGGGALTLEYEESELSKWTLEAAEGGFYIKSNTTNGSNAQYLEYYKNLFTTYKITGDVNIYIFQFFTTDKEQEPFPPKPTMPADGSELSVNEINNLPLKDGEISTERYYVTATITSVTKKWYGAMYIADGTGSVAVYNSLNADGSVTYENMTDKPVKGDTVKMLVNVKNFGGTMELHNAYIVEYTHNTVDQSQYAQMTIAQARQAAIGTKVIVSGVVAQIIYSGGGSKIASGIILVDATGSIYVYGNDVAQNVTIGNTISVATTKTMWIRDDEVKNAEKFGYAGCNQLDDPYILTNDNGNSDFDKSWITETTVQDLLNVPCSTDITTTIFKVTAHIKKVPGSGFVNYYINDLDGVTGAYTYTQCNGADFAWLDAFDGKICTVYVMAINAKSEATSCFWRLLPVAVIDEGFDVTTVDIPQNALDLYVMPQLSLSYTSSFSVDLLASVNNELLKYTDAKVSYVSSKPEVLTFEEVDGKVVLKALTAGTTTVTVTVTHNGKTASETIEITVTEKPAIDYVNVSTAINTQPGTAEAPVYVTVMGIVGPSLVNQNGFYLIDETGVIAVVMKNSADLANIEMGQEIILTGVRFRKVKDGSTDFGQTCINEAEVVVNNGGKHDYSTKGFKGEISIENFVSFDSTVDHSTEIYTMKVSVIVVENQAVKIKSADGKYSITLYHSSSAQYSWLTQFNGQEVTLEIAACNWNSKGYKGCVLSVTLADGTRIYNTTNFDKY